MICLLCEFFVTNNVIIDHFILLVILMNNRVAKSNWKEIERTISKVLLSSMDRVMIISLSVCNCQVGDWCDLSQKITFSRRGHVSIDSMHGESSFPFCRNPHNTENGHGLPI